MKIKQFLGKTISLLFDKYYNVSYSQEGEDLILKQVFNEMNLEIGFYVDVGAHHPKRFSNTYLFYKSGWRGINIDANPDSMKLFRKIRTRDVNLELAISNHEKKLNFYQFNEAALNTFSKERVKKIAKNNNYHLNKSIKIKTKRLENILDIYLPKNQQISFLNIDVEGMDMDVLKSNNWDKYIPKVVLIEERPFKHENSFIYSFLRRKGYVFLAKTIRTIFYIHNTVNA